MEAKDLRIGNYLQDRQGDLCKVELISKNNTGTITFKAPVIKGPFTHSPHTPIPLTEEWLVKFGFEVCNRTNSTITDYVIFGENGLDFFTVFCIDINKGLGFAGCKYKIKYVHQLQNLYFALTNEELIIKTK